MGYGVWSMGVWVYGAAQLNAAQLRHTKQAAEWSSSDGGKFADTIQGSGAQVWIHAEPLHSPPTLKRCWCLDELRASIDTAKGFELMLGEEEASNLVGILSNNFESIQASFAAIDVRKAKASRQEDQE